MSLMKTFPAWAPTAVATEQGWVDPKTKEVYVSIKRLASRLAEENSKTPVNIEVELAQGLSQKIEIVVPDHIEKVEEIIKPKEVIMEPVVTEEVRVKRAYVKKLRVNEVVEQPKDAKIIGEVVEHDVDAKIIGE